MIYIEQDFLSRNDLMYIENLIYNFVPEQEPKRDYKNYYRNDYFKQQVPLTDTILTKINQTIKKYTDKDIVVKTIWLNKIDVNSNQDDDFHRDGTHMSFVIYPFDDFVGGELELRTETLPIQKNIAYIMLHNIEHRVKKVTEGVRWSIAVFCDYDNKNKNII